MRLFLKLYYIDGKLDEYQIFIYNADILVNYSEKQKVVPLTFDKNNKKVHREHTLSSDIEQLVDVNCLSDISAEYYIDGVFSEYAVIENDEVVLKENLVFP